MTPLYHTHQLLLFPETENANKREKAHQTVTLICASCGIKFQRRKGLHDFNLRHYGTQPTFCDRRCIHGNSNKIPIPPSIKEEYIRGDSLQTIGDRYNLSRTTIEYHLRKMGVSIRTRKECIDLNGSPMKGKHHSEETKAKLSEYSIKQFSSQEARDAVSTRNIHLIKEGLIPVVSGLEDRVAVELSNRGIAFTRQWGINKPGTQGFIGCVDFMLADGRVIEVNGTFWHSDPRKYPDGPVHISQKRNAAKYAKKVAALAELGIPLIELWELDLTTDFTGTITKALAS